MLDQYHRSIDYARISVTDRCNLRCIYCMPKEGVTSTPHQEILTYDEICQICEMFAELGISKIKITGGEPLVRKNLSRLVSDLKKIKGIEKITLTTNGLLLGEQMDSLVQAGIDGINISLDALDDEIYKDITGCKAVTKVRESLAAAMAFKNIKLKVNCVPIKGINDEEIVRLASLAKENAIWVRFIEMMPIGLGQQFEAYSEAELVTILEEKLGELIPHTDKQGNGPARYYRISGFVGEIGFISALSHRFCSDCNRIRLTSTGFLKTCLQYEQGAELKPLLRKGTDKELLKEVICKTIYDKPLQHHFERRENCSLRSEKMFEIGG